MRAEDGHKVHHIDIKLAVGDFIDGVKIAFHHDGEVAASAFMLKEFA